MEQHVWQVLKIDHQSRDLDYLREETDLFAFEDLVIKEWDHSLPTLISGETNKMVASTKDFIDAYSEAIPFHQINLENVLVAGGAISSILTKNKLHDIDLFIYGLTPEQATIRVDRLIHDLSQSYEEHLQIKQLKADKNLDKQNMKTPTYDFKYIRNNNCVTLIFDDQYIFQIILRIYHNKSQILHGFDLGSSAVGFDGQRLYFTSLSKFAYEYSCNIVDTTRRSTTYELRLIKYFMRKFDIIMPHLNVSQLRTINSKYKMADVCELPYLVFSYLSVRGNKIKIMKFLSSFDHKLSDYQITDLNHHQIFYINLHNLVWNKTDYYFYSESVKNQTAIKPLISRRRIINYYDELLLKLKKGGVLNLRMLRKYLRNTSEVMRVLVEKGDSDKQFMILLEHEIQMEKQRILGLVDYLLDNDFPLHWMTENPGTQMTSSFNPIIEDIRKWYGIYYVETPPPPTYINSDDRTDENEDEDENEDDN